MKAFMQEVKQNLEEILKDVKGCEEFLICLKDVKFPWQILDLMDKIERFDYKSNHMEGSVEKVPLVKLIY